MAIAKIRGGTFTIPVEIRKKANLEDGNFIEVKYKPDENVVILKPKVLIDEEDYVILSKKGEKMIEEALEAEKSGDVVGPFSDIESAIKALKRLMTNEKKNDTSVATLDSLDDMEPQELKALLDIQTQYESKDRLREFLPMQVDFDTVEFEDDFPANVMSPDGKKVSSRYE